MKKKFKQHYPKEKKERLKKKLNVRIALEKL